MGTRDYTALTSATGGGSNVQAGFGGMKQWEAIEKHALGPSDVTTLPGMEAIPFGEADKPSGLVGQKLNDLSASIERLSKANEAALKGEIPADVAAATRRAASEGAVVGGIFGSSARNLSARDLGRTSFDVKQQGIKNESGLLEARSQLAAAHESIRKTNLDRNNILAELSIKARDQNLGAINVERQRIATNIEANSQILSYISNMAIQQQNIAAQAAAQEIDPANIIGSLDHWIEEFSAKLSS